jgi:hypothetical protein
MKEINAADIERLNVVILIIGSLFSLIVMRDFRYFFSFASGSAVMTLNFRMLRKIIEGGFLKTPLNKKELLIKLPLKFLSLIAAVVAIVVYGDVNAVFFLLGLSTVFLSIIVNQCFGLRIPVARRRQKDGT